MTQSFGPSSFNTSGGNGGNGGLGHNGLGLSCLGGPNSLGGGNGLSGGGGYVHGGYGGGDGADVHPHHWLPDREMSPLHHGGGGHNKGNNEFKLFKINGDEEYIITSLQLTLFAGL